MSTGTKAWRGYICEGAKAFRVASEHPTLKANCTVIPDGASVPLPDDVVCVLAAAVDLIEKEARQNGSKPEEYRQSHPRAYALYRAVEAYERAEKRRKAGGR